MELFKSLENVFNKMLMLTSWEHSFFKQDASKILYKLMSSNTSVNCSIYFPIVVIVPQNCVDRSAAPFTEGKHSYK